MRSLYRTVDRGTLRDIALVCVADAIVGASFGAIAVAGGLAPWVPIVMSVIVFAGGSQFAAVGVVLAGGSPIAAVAAALVLNARLVPFGFAVADALGDRWWTRLLGAHLTTDETVAFVMVRRDPRQRRAVLWVCGLGLFAAWNLAVVVGAFAGQGLGDPDALGLDAAFPVVLLALVLPALADPATRTAALVGAVVAVAATPFLPAGLPVLLALVGLLPTVRSMRTRDRGEDIGDEPEPEPGSRPGPGPDSRSGPGSGSNSGSGSPSGPASGAEPGSAADRETS
ncbi:AzlC family ABC transporter permease [Streptomyces sp. SID3343]|uniref:AzlC family ABC transporter permease n=1 Tax=Streptomyces sp. SID3343 TaxID=2690260 RepID=UPI00136CF9DC|nr:AzlC family ABC transporter permease [Streptomyces sp. SID3343]MYW01413.1 branched-chain amino acid ABC transporter permease [Streptomyces sp. SID3343]